MDMTRPAIIAHGGAGPGPNRTANLEPAIAKGREILLAGGNAIEAAVEACVILENDPVFNAGTGSVIRTDGAVLTDASLQTSEGKLGFVIAMRDTPNPIRICVDLLEEEINGLAGLGARKWADQRGHLNAPVVGRQPEGQIGDTVGVIARDSEGLLAAATSTGGCSHRPPGRVGDVPLPGSGFWVEGSVAVAATGIGEAITCALLSNKVYERIIASKEDSIESLSRAMNWGIESLIAPTHQVGLIALGSDGEGRGESNTDMPWATWCADL
jgi:isoaspartyl peptidase/L-asparaginase-like protein (Ntn-hydrolase superfamily)